MKYIAHSARENIPAQSYKNHVEGVSRRAVNYAREAEIYLNKSNGELEKIVHNSAVWHDLGKLDEYNQKALFDNNRRNLPINHVDAGTTLLKNEMNMLSALVVYSHHKGLPDMSQECLKSGEDILRDKSEIKDSCLINNEKNISIKEYTDRELKQLRQRHIDSFGDKFLEDEKIYDGNQGMFYRMLLSCLADADHTDTATLYNNELESVEKIDLRADERLKMLDKYVNGLGGDDERSKLRNEMYFECRNISPNGGFVSCDSPVGSGKTTAVMAHMLKQAVERKARRIFVVLPYTSIIKQSVDVYRKAIVLQGEDPEAVVGELHSKADFQDQDVRYLTSLWRAPIIVTTAVAFFETLASNKPSALRKLHELPGSIIFIDEAHNVLPLKLFPLAWKWMNVLADEWSCYWVLASGSLVRYWQLNSLSDINMPKPYIPEIVNKTLHTKLMEYEHNRTNFKLKEEPLDIEDLIKWVHGSDGPRLLIMNTVQNAAVIANEFCNKFGRQCVEHLSTALTAEDRDRTIEIIEKRLKDENDFNWTLVATSCVEAGVDFSFRTGFREISSMLSLLQASGRVNRNGKFDDAEMWSFTMREDSRLNKNKEVDISAEVLRSYFRKGISITPELSTESINKEIIRDDSCISKMKTLLSEENAGNFETIKEKFKVIESDSRMVIVDEDLAKQISIGKSDWRQLQKKSISLYNSKIKEKAIDWNLKEPIVDKLYQWTLGYDSFLGYMRGVLDLEKSREEILFV